MGNSPSKNIREMHTGFRRGESKERSRLEEHCVEGLTRSESPTFSQLRLGAGGVMLRTR